MLYKPTVFLSMVCGTHALTTRQDACAFTLTTGGSVSAPVGQYGSGQTRAGLSETPSKFVLEGNTIVDEQGRGCWWTPPALVLQCDVGQIPETGFNIGCDGSLSYNGQTTFYECVTGVDDIVMIYREPNGSNCGKISLEASECSSDNCSSSKPPSTATMTVPGNSSTAAAPTATRTSSQFSSTSSVPDNSTITSKNPKTSDSTGSSTASSTPCETTELDGQATTSKAESSATQSSYQTSNSSAPAFPRTSGAPTYGPCESNSTSVYATMAPPNTPTYPVADSTGQDSSIATPSTTSGWNSTTSTQTGSESSFTSSAPSGQPSTIKPETQSVPGYPTGTSEETDTAEETTAASTSNAETPSLAYSTSITTATSCDSDVTDCPGNSPTSAADVTSTVDITSTVPCNTTAAGSSGSPTSPGTSSTLLKATAATTSHAIPTGMNATTPCTTSSAPPTYPTSQTTTTLSRITTSAAPGTNATTSPCATSGGASRSPSPSSTSPPPPPPTCPGELTGDWQSPRLMIPIDSRQPDTCLGTTSFGEVSATVSTVFRFDIPASYGGRTCTAVFLWPEEREAYNFTGGGSATTTAIGFARLEAGVVSAEATTFNSVPGLAQTSDLYAMAPRNAYALASFECPAGAAVAFVMSSLGAAAAGETSFRYRQDPNPCPLGLYITASGAE
ncbi:ubiquitin 3 binding protein But2 C-terminal domain-containing protein [Biscogniauxia mediterranea]|nr:ubiquitin 3 binding protein But2 C-terminal domain-containing protein [Biscogniauxia mediterranea]